MRAVIAKSFARIHAANLINAGILPLTFKDPNDFDLLAQDDKMSLKNIFKGLEDGNIILQVEGKGEIPLTCNFTERQRDILLAGGLLKYTKKS